MHSGMKKTPLCKHDSINADVFFPMLWNSIVPTTDIGINIRNMQYILSASLPIFTTTSSVLKSDIICGANAKHIADIAPRNAIPKPKVNSVPFFTLEYFFAP